jgi:hypothetical protein
MRSQHCGRAVLYLLFLASQLSACLHDKEDTTMHSLGSFPKSIAIDNNDNLYIATVKGQVIRYDGQSLSRIIDRGSHGMDFAEKIRYSQGRLYIHNRRYSEAQQTYINEVLLFDTDGSYISHLLEQSDANTKQLGDIVANQVGQLYSITNLQDVLRINYDRQKLVTITPMINIDSLSSAIKDVLTQLDYDIASLTDSTNSLIQDNVDNLSSNGLDISSLDSQLSNLSVTDLADNIDTVQEVSNAITISLPLLGLSDITIDQSNNVYMSCLLGVFKFDGDGNFIKSITTTNEHGIAIPHSLAADPYGNMIVAGYHPDDAYNMQFVKFDRDGNYVDKFIKDDVRGIFTSIQDIAFDSAGNFYVVDFLKGIHKFNPNGQFEKIIAKPFD